MNIKKTFLILLSFSVFITGYIHYPDNSLSKYQWGLYNSGNFYVPNNLLRVNHEFLPYTEDLMQLTYLDGTVISAMSSVAVSNHEYTASQVGTDIHYNQAYQLFDNCNTKAEVIVALIDSGIDINHKDLKDNIWVNTDEVPYNGIDDDDNGYVDDYYGYNFYENSHEVFTSPIDDIHATHEAGIIVAKHNNEGIKGIAYDDKNRIKVMPLKILGLNGKGSIGKLYEAIRYAHDNGAKICNISLGSYSEEEELKNIINEFDDMLFVVAAGNGANYIGYNIDLRYVYPASYNFSNLITVGNLSLDGSMFESSNYGISVDLFAPGTYILSTLPYDSYGFMTGTSMSTPFVSAVAAMIMSMWPNATPADVKEILRSSSDVDSRLVGYCFSGGRLDAYNAMLVALDYFGG